MKKCLVHLFRMFVLVTFIIPLISCEQDDIVPSLYLAEGNNIDAYAGDEIFLHIEHSPSKVSLPELVWSDYDPNILWVFPSASKIIAKKSGTTSLSIGTEDKTLTMKCTINVSPIVLTLSDTICTMLIADTLSLKTMITPERTSEKLNWNSSDKSVAKVDANGKVTAVGVGECTITCAAVINNVKEPVSDQCRIVVSPIKMTSLELSDKELRLELEKSYKLSASFEPSHATYKTLYWSSSDKSVATVDNTGRVKAVGVGECVISVENKENGLKAECKVETYMIAMTSLVLHETKRSIALGECSTFDLKATYEPSYVTYPKLYWSSSDEKVAKVSDGKVSIMGVIGSCIISVTNKDKSLNAQCEIEVYKQGITAINCPEEMSAELGDKFVLSVTCLPSFISPGCKTLYWQSSDESIAKVNKNSGQVTCMNIGECIITVGNTYNDVTATCHLTVLPILVKQLSLSKSSLMLFVGESEKLACTVSPNTAMNKEVKWESSDNSVVTVSEDGTVTATGRGNAIIKVISQDGSCCTAECAVTVHASKEQYVQDYVMNNISISITGESSAIGPWGSYHSYTFEVKNNGNDKIYLKRVQGYGSSYGSLPINQDIEAGGSYSESFKSKSLDFVFEMYGYECVKRFY